MDQDNFLLKRSGKEPQQNYNEENRISYIHKIRQY